METYLIKSTAILAIFWVLYVLFLEKENMHRFKRFYLLTSIVAAFCIPLLSITQYVYVEPMDGLDLSNATIPFSVNESFEVVETPFWTLERILWSVYILGVAIFSLRFIKNLFSIVKTINTNEKQKQSSITFVLLKTLINPHTFFNFIFLNKLKFQKNEVPKEVLLHEEVHAKQKHSLDILFIELMQIVFWFQPFIWLFKKRIKLNHEFLADQAVIKAGFESSTYQNTLLSYSSHKDCSLANAIDYSSIKKRFTVMKTQTSKPKKWLLSLLILPVLGILFYSFSDREIVEVELVEKQETQQKLDYTINVDENSKFYFEEQEFELNEVEKFIPIIDNLQIKLELAPKYDSSNLQDLISKVISEFTKRGVGKLSVCSSQNFEEDEQQNPPTAKEIADYNAWAKKINTKNSAAEKAKNGEYAIVKHKEVLKYKAIYYRMTKTQKSKAEAWPNFPPPPPPPPAPKVLKNQKSKSNIPPPPPPPMPKEAKGKLTHHHVNAYNEWLKYIKSDNPNPKYMTVEIYEYYKGLYNAMTDEQKKLTDEMPPPPPPPPPAPKKANKSKGGPNANITSEASAYLGDGKFKVQLKKEGNLITMKCYKGCQWENLKFDLRNNSPMIVNQFGLNKVDPQSSNRAFYFVLHQDDGTFTLKSTKNTSWNGFSSSSKENLNLTFSNDDVKQNKK